jgi:hypothetical protein
MWHLLKEVFSFTLGDVHSIVFVAQIVSLFALVYFLSKSYRRLYIDLNAAHGSHNFPALGVAYTFLSAVFIFIFIGYFDEITEHYQKLLHFSYINYYTSKNLYVDEIVQDDIQEARYWIALSLPFVLTAFAMNFSKSFSTLNSLELGLLNGQKIESLSLSKNRIHLERVLRVLIAFAFIAIEKEFSDWDHGGKLNFVGTFYSLSIEIAVLYLVLLIWLFVLFKPAHHQSNFKNWCYLAPVQFSMGLILSIVYFFFSSINETYILWWKKRLYISAISMITLSLLIITVVSALEFIRWRTNQDSGNTPTE